MRSDISDTVFLAVTEIGGSIIMWLFLSLYYWCLDRKAASRLIVLFLFSAWLVSILKRLFDQPRPYMLDASVKIGDETGPGIPSGHAQNMIIVWGYLIFQVQKGWFTALALSMILLVSFSRIYLGLHFPTDVFGSWLIGEILLLLFYCLHEKIEARFVSFKSKIQFLLAAAIPCMFAMIQPNKYSVTPMAVLAGFCLGYLIERKMIGFNEARAAGIGFVRYVAGVTILVLLFFVADIVTPNSPAYMICLFINYFMIGLWTGAGAPWLFKKMNL
jgi:membrane-associated phospholipid phosphatase